MSMRLHYRRGHIYTYCTPGRECRGTGTALEKEGGAISRGHTAICICQAGGMMMAHSGGEAYAKLAVLNGGGYRGIAIISAAGAVAPGPRLLKGPDPGSWLHNYGTGKPTKPQLNTH